MSKVYKRIVLSLFAAAIGLNLGAQTEGAHNSYSPYSIFGLGDIYTQGSAYNKSMGGVGIALRNNRYINYLNPAAITARDTLSFMADVGFSLQNKAYYQGDRKSANNNFNISNIAFTVPVYGKTTFIMGLTPYSDVGYDYTSFMGGETLPQTGYISRAAKGEGGVYQLFTGLGFNLGKNLSVGVQGNYYFGKIDKDYIYTFESTSTNSIYSGYDIQLHALTGKLGVQYEKRIGHGLTLTAGITHRLKTGLRGTIRDYKFSSLSSVTDTLRYSIDTLSSGRGIDLAGETGIGLSLRRGDKWLFEVDYTFSDWSKTGYAGAVGFANRNDISAFTTTKAYSLRAGFEYTPNRNDIRYYFRRCTYRAGAYYDKAYYKLNGSAVNSYGVTFGLTLPVFRWHNGLTIGVDLGQRGKITNTLIKERYASISIGFNIHDIWFQKPKYE